MIKIRNIKKDHRNSFTIQDYQASAIASKIVGIVPVDCEIVSIKEVHTTAGNHASAVTLNVEKLRNTETVGTGNALLATGLNLKGTASTVQSGTLLDASKDKRLQPFTSVFKAGDRVGLVVTGDTTALAGMRVTIEFRPVEAWTMLSNSPSSSASSSVSASVSASISSSVSASASSSISSSASSSPSVSSSVSSSPSA